MTYFFNWMWIFQKLDHVFKLTSENCWKNGWVCWKKKCLLLVSTKLTNLSNHQWQSSVFPQWFCASNNPSRLERISSLPRQLRNFQLITLYVTGSLQNINLKGGFGPKLYFTESYLNIILDGGNKYFFIPLLWLKTGTVPVFRWGVTGSNLLGHQIQLEGSESPTLGTLKPEPNGRDDHISVNMARRTKLHETKVA